MNRAIIAITRRALPLMTPARRAEAEALILSLERTADGADNELRTFFQHAAMAWTTDMGPVSNALVAALHIPDIATLKKLRGELPDLLNQVNTDPTLAGVLSRQLFRIFAATIGEIPAAPAALSLSNRQTSNSASLAQWRSRTPFPTDFSSADLRGLSSELHLRSIFSARTTNADYLNEVANTVDDLLAGKTNIAYARLALMKKLKQLGYDVERGFPQDMANIPPAEKDSLQDLSSERRIDLMLKTNVAITRNYGRVVEGNTAFARYAWPAWELRRLENRVTPRGSEDSHTVGWQRRWQDAGESIAWQGASQSPMIALKDSPIWQALGDGEGGYQDSLGHPFPPFAFNSGYDWRAVPREEAISLDLLQRGKGESAPMKASLAPGENETVAAFKRLAPDLQAVLKARWAE